MAFFISDTRFDTHESLINLTRGFSFTSNKNTVCCEGDGVITESGVCASRTYYLAAPYVLFVVDKVSSDSEGTYSTDFVFNNSGDSLHTHIADERRLVLRHGDSAMKLFCFTEGDISLSQSTHSNDCIYSYASKKPSSSHFAVYAVVACEENIVGWWHLSKNGRFLQILSPRDEQIWSLEPITGKFTKIK